MSRLLALPLAPGPGRGWAAELGLRCRRHVVVKMLGICAFMWVFFIAYFHLLRHPVHPVTVMPVTVIDRLIPFQPQALAAYVSLWLYIGIAPGLLLTLREILVYGLWIAALCVTGLACFYAWPTVVPALDPAVLGHGGFALLQRVDAAGNACPSLHVATAIFTALRVEHLLRQVQTPAVLRILNGVWCTAIVYSTLATKQHVVLDALAGAMLGIAFALPSIAALARPGKFS